MPAEIDVRALVSQAENNEVSGNVSSETMQTIAEAMGGRFVYAVLPPKGKETEDVIFAQAMKQMRRVVEQANTQMAFETRVFLQARVKIKSNAWHGAWPAVKATGFWNDK